MFPELSPYGNYEVDCVPPHLDVLPCDGSIRHANRLGLPYVKVVEVYNAYGRTFLPRVVGYALRKEDLAAVKRAANKPKNRRDPRPHPDVLLCAQEASRAAHRHRDDASDAYERGLHLTASSHKRKKEHFYALKDRGIVHAHAKGLLRYVGATAQGLALYEGEGHCFHSTLHPKDAVRSVVEDHPETIFVAAKAKAKGLSIRRVEVTLEALPHPDLDSYVRSDRPARPREEVEIECWECGEPGHIAADCPG